MVERDLFSGPDSLRLGGETRALWACIIAAPVTIGLVSLMLPSVSLSEFILLIVGGMLFVSVARGRLLGSSIRIDARQLPELDEIAREVAAQLGMTPPQLFVRDDPFVPITSAGTGEPYALIISSEYYEHLRRDELAFLIARELAHIAAGHTRLTSLLSASGRENPIVAVVFGAWLRRTEYTADRVGLLCCGRLDHALGAISISNFHAIGRRVDMRVLAEQRAELAADPALRVGEWISAVPYATNRLEALRAFDTSALARTWRARLATPASVANAVAPEPAGDVSRRDCAPTGRRLAAMAIDLTILAAILKTPAGIEATKATKVSASDVPEFLRPLLQHSLTYSFAPENFFTLLAFFAYSMLMVSMTGQTLGMMIMELRVVTTRYARPTPWQTVWRYSVALATTSTVFLALFGFLVRVHPHDRLSKTRLVRGRKAA